MFDLDDTITDFRTASDKAFSVAFGDISRETGVSLQLMRDTYMDLFEDFYTMHLQGDINLEEFHVYRFSRMFELLHLPMDDRFLDMCVDFEDVYDRSLEMFPDAMDVLVELSQAYPMALITNGPTEAQWFKINKFHLADLFEIVLVSDQIGIAKPDPRIFQVALAGMRVRPSEAVMVGNSLEHDQWGAINSGCRFIWANLTRERLPDGWPEPDAEVHSWEALRPLLFGLEIEEDDFQARTGPTE
jgi:putative hydrolase of the HAD superfamily